MTNPFAPPDAMPAPSAWAPQPQAWGPPPAGWSPTTPGWGPPPGVLPAVNTWAVVALATGRLFLFPISITAGIVALVQIRRRGERGTGLAVAGIVLGGVSLLVAALATVGFLVSDASSTDAVLGRVADAGSLNQRTCLLLADKELSPASPVGCAQPHDGEVFLVNTLPDRAWPGYGQTENDADDLCYSGFEDYVGTSYDSSDYDYGYFRPDRAEWLAGERRVVCVIVSSDGSQLHGPAYNSER